MADVDELAEILDSLQGRLAQVDLIVSNRSGNSRFIEFLVVKRQRLKIKMYQELGHKLPHIHIDYGKEHHVASYSIQPAERIEGDLDRVYDREIKDWIEKNRAKILELWERAQSGKAVTALVQELQGSL
jgi:hypothetical protein